jgi:hypothetical protein
MPLALQITAFSALPITAAANRSMPWPQLILAALLAGLVTGCAALGLRPSEKAAPSRSESLKTMDPARIQADTMGFADRFVATMTDVCDELERRAPTPAAKDAAHQLKTDLALGVISDAVSPRPIAGLIDMVVLVTLLRQIAEDPWADRMFGTDASRLVETLQRQETDIRSLASQYLTDPQLAELSQLADRWYRAHPDERSVSHVHLADLPEANRPPEEAGKLPSSVFGLLFFDPTADLDPTVREIELSRATSERMFFYLQRLPLLLQLQVESFYRQVLDVPQLERVLDDVSAVAGSATRFAEASREFTDIVGCFPQQLSEERQQAVLQIASEWTQQRDAAIRQLAEAVAVQREAAITEATTRIAFQREEAIRQMASALRQEQQAFVANLEAATDRSINHLLKGLAALGLVLVVVVVGGAFTYRRLSHRRPDRPEHPA